MLIFVVTEAAGKPRTALPTDHAEASYPLVFHPASGALATYRQAQLLPLATTTESTGAAWTVTSWLTEAVAPLLSVTVSVTE